MPTNEDRLGQGWSHVSLSPGGGNGCAQSKPSPKTSQAQQTPWEPVLPGDLERGGRVRRACLPAPPTCRRLWFSDIKMSSSSQSLPPWAPRAFSKQALGQLHKENYSPEPSTGLSPAKCLSQAKFVCYPTDKWPEGYIFGPPQTQAGAEGYFLRNPIGPGSMRLSIDYADQESPRWHPLEGKRENWRAAGRVSAWARGRGFWFQGQDE